MCETSGTDGCGDVRIVVLCKGIDRYILVYALAQRREAIRTLGRWAADPELTFSWRDVASALVNIRALG